MRKTITLIAALFLAIGAANAAANAGGNGFVTATCHSSAALPDHHCTPGATDPRVTQANVAQTICVSGWTKRVRPPTSVTNPTKAEREVAYGIPPPHPKPFRVEELDHLIPLELGGAADDVKNLWPQPATGQDGYHRKDRLETRLKRLVCAGQLKLRVAQRAIAADWLSAYHRYIGP
jgi:hypothetical protein